MISDIGEADDRLTSLFISNEVGKHKEKFHFQLGMLDKASYGPSKFYSERFSQFWTIIKGS